MTVYLQPLAKTEFFGYTREEQIARDIERRLTLPARLPPPLYTSTPWKSSRFFNADFYADAELRTLAAYAWSDAEATFKHYETYGIFPSTPKPPPLVLKDETHDHSDFIGGPCAGPYDQQRDSCAPRVPKDRRMPYWRPGGARANKRRARGLSLYSPWTGRRIRTPGDVKTG